MTTQTLPRRRSTTSAVSSRFAEGWRHYSACTPNDKDLFFPAGNGPAAEQQVMKAKKVCSGCTVREQCLQWALEEGEDFGVLGGLDHKERRRLLRGQGPSASSEARDAEFLDVDVDAVDAYLTGESSNVSSVDRLAAIVAGVRQGMLYKDFDDLHGLTREATSKWVSRTRRSYTDRGLVFPDMVRPDPKRNFTDEQVVWIRKRVATGDVTCAELGREYGVSGRTIARMVSGESYQDVGGPISGLPTSSMGVRAIGQTDLGAAA